MICAQKFWGLYARIKSNASSMSAQLNVRVERFASGLRSAEMQSSVTVVILVWISVLIFAPLVDVFKDRVVNCAMGCKEFE